MVQHILDVVDMQVDFMRPKGKLSVPFSEPLIALTNEFFKNIPANLFDAALFKYDTHFDIEYPHNPERKTHPAIHCEYGTEGWGLAVDPSMLKGKMQVWYMAKNTFDMWGQNPVPAKTKLKFDSENTAKAYANLFNVTDDPQTSQRGFPRDEFLRAMGLGAGEGLCVTMLGVATDIAVHDAALGYLLRGARVRIVEDLVTGIGTAIAGRAYSGTLRSVLELPVFVGYVKQQQVTVIGSMQVGEKVPNILP